MRQERLETIAIMQALPEVFGTEKHNPSDVWLAELMLERGRDYLIEASSGAGKSSLCAYIYGSRRDYRGRIMFNGTDITAFSISDWQQLRRVSLGYMPQELGLFSELTALENVLLKNDLTGHFSRAQIDVMFEYMGIADRRDSQVARMSVGQRQRVALIRALCQPFDFLMLDEPVSHLDAENNRIAAVLVEQEARRQGASVISTSVGNRLQLSDAKKLIL